MRRRIFLLLTTLFALLGFKSWEEQETWHGRWARAGVRTRADWKLYLRVTLPGYADLDDEYEALLRLHQAGKISDRTMSKLGGKKLETIWQLEQKWFRRTYGEDFGEEVIDELPKLQNHARTDIVWNRELSPEEFKQVDEEIRRWARDPNYIPIFPAGARLSGADGTYSCGQGQGDNVGVVYSLLRKGRSIRFERLQ